MQYSQQFYESPTITICFSKMTINGLTLVYDEDFYISYRYTSLSRNLLWSFLSICLKFVETIMEAKNIDSRNENILTYLSISFDQEMSFPRVLLALWSTVLCCHLKLGGIPSYVTVVFWGLMVKPMRNTFEISLHSFWVISSTNMCKTNSKWAFFFVISFIITKCHSLPQPQGMRITFL